MKDTRAALRYATAIFDLALSGNALAPVSEDMKMIARTIRESREFQSFLSSPVVKADVKAKILNQIFEGKVQDGTLTFLRMLAKMNREGILPQITIEFDKLYLTHQGLQKAVVTTAVGLDENLRKEIIKLAKTQTKAEVELVEKINPDLIGGFTLKIGDQMIDSSVVRSLKKLKTTLESNPFKTKL